MNQRGRKAEAQLTVNTVCINNHGSDLLCRSDCAGSRILYICSVEFISVCFMLTFSSFFFLRANAVPAGVCDAISSTSWWLMPFKTESYVLCQRKYKTKLRSVCHVCAWLPAGWQINFFFGTGKVGRFPPTTLLDQFSHRSLRRQ